MCPDDPTPLGDAMTHRFPDQKIPDPKPNRGAAHARHEEPAPSAQEIAERPPLPGGASREERR
jgi:hypothetical protein